MGIFDLFRKNKEPQNKSEEKVLSKVNDIEEAYKILEEESENFFPKNGRWGHHCFEQPDDLHKSNLPCHLRDHDWLTDYFSEKIKETRELIIPTNVIRQFVVNSKKFNELRHNYELEIVRWQINWMRNDCGGWLLPKDCDDFSLLLSPDAVEIFRAGIVKTLSAIGMDGEVIEEGIEKNADMFREGYIKRGFENEFERVDFRGVLPPPADEEHRKNWLKLKRYAYYCNHKMSVDKYGRPHPDMLMSQEEVNHLCEVLPKQNEERRKVIAAWRKKDNSAESQEDFYK